MPVSTENSPGKKDPALHPIVVSSGSTGRNSLSAAVAAVTNAPLASPQHFSGGRLLP